EIQNSERASIQLDATTTGVGGFLKRRTHANIRAKLIPRDSNYTAYDLHAHSMYPVYVSIQPNSNAHEMDACSCRRSPLQNPRQPVLLSTMWNVETQFENSTIDVLPAAGYNVRNTGGVVRVEKYGCAAELRRTPGGRYQMTLLPAVLIGGQFSRL